METNVEFPDNSGTQALIDADRNSHLHPFTSVLDQQTNRGLIVDTAEGITIRDRDGNSYLDAAAGLWCVNVGYGRREISDAMHTQSLNLSYYHSFNSTSNEPSALLSERLLDLAPDNMKRVFFGTSGSDANDSAVKLVWYYNICRGKPEKRKILSRKFGYHGVTLASGSLSGVPMVHQHFGLPLDFVKHVSKPDLYRDAPARGAVTEREYSKMLAAEIEDMILAEGAETVGAFIAEPVLGTGGVLPPPEGYFQAIREVLDRHDVLLIADEVITGFGRLGEWFGTDIYDMASDIIVTAKGLTSGYLPLSAVLVGERVWNVIESASADARVFAHGFTYSGHPVCAAAAMANLDIIEGESLVSRVAQISPLFLGQIQQKLLNCPIVGDIRGAGLMIGIEIVEDRAEKKGFEPELKTAAKIALAAREEGVLVRALPNSDIIALSPSFCVTDPELEQIVNRLDKAIGVIVEKYQVDGLI
jgi:L-2,4-diaminobutyrate transaminase